MCLAIEIDLIAQEHGGTDGAVCNAWGYRHSLIPGLSAAATPGSTAFVSVRDVCLAPRPCLDLAGEVVHCLAGEQGVPFLGVKYSIGHSLGDLVVFILMVSDGCRYVNSVRNRPECVVADRRTPLVENVLSSGPGGAMDCSHGWSVARFGRSGTRGRRGRELAVPEGRRKRSTCQDAERSLCPCRGKPFAPHHLHGFRVGRLHRRVASPVATFQSPLPGLQEL